MCMIAGAVLQKLAKLSVLADGLFYRLAAAFKKASEMSGPHRYFPELFLFHIEFIPTYYIGKYWFLP